MLDVHDSYLFVNFNRDAQIKEALAEEERLAAKFLNETEVAKAKRDFELKKAIYDQEVNTKKADSQLAYSLQVKLLWY